MLGAAQVQESLPKAAPNIDAALPGASRTLAAALHLEMALMHQHYRQAAAAQAQLDHAAAALGVSVSVTGKAWRGGSCLVEQLSACAVFIVPAFGRDLLQALRPVQ